MIVNANFEILNAPESIGNRYVVARYVRDNNIPQFWYYGQYDNRERAEYVAKEIGNGIVFEVRYFFASPESILNDLTKFKTDHNIDM